MTSSPRQDLERFYAAARNHQMVNKPVGPYKVDDTAANERAQGLLRAWNPGAEIHSVIAADYDDACRLLNARLLRLKREKR